VARYEAGRTSPSVRTLEHLLRAAGFCLEVKATKSSTATDLSTPRMQGLRAVRSQVEAAVQAVGGSNIRVFGSTARGDERLDSDVDLLVDLPIGVSGRGPLIDLSHELSDVLGMTVEVATPELLKPTVVRQVMAEAVPL
jgi:uncharacterized protein